jgi:hypothetical protein
MAWKRVLAVPLLTVSLLAVGAGCGGGDDEAPQASSTFCQHAADFGEAAAIEPGSVERVLDGLTRLAEIYGAMADSAPVEVRDEVERLAASAQAVAARLQEANPGSMEELSSANEDVTAAVEAEFGDLDPAAATVSAYIGEQCGVEIAQ